MTTGCGAGQLSGLVIDQQEQPLRLTGRSYCRDGLLQQVVAQPRGAGIHADAERVGQAKLPADVVHPGHAQAAVPPDVDSHVGPGGPQAAHQIPQVVVGAEGGVTGAVPQPDQQDHVVLGAGDDDRQVLILLVVAVEHDQLLLPVRRVVEGVEVEGEVRRRRVEGLEEQIDQHVAQPPQVGDRDGVLEPREGGLAGEVGVVGESVGEELEDGVRPQGVVVVLVLVIGEDAVDPLADHAQERLPGERRVAGVVEGGGELLGEPDPLVELPDHQQPAIAGQPRRRCFHDDRQIGMKPQDKLPRRLSTHPTPPCGGPTCRHTTR